MTVALVTFLLTGLVINSAELVERRTMPPKEGRCVDPYQIKINTCSGSHKSGECGRHTITTQVCPDPNVRAVWIFPPDNLTLETEVHIDTDTIATCRELRSLQDCARHCSNAAQNSEVSAAPSTESAMHLLCSCKTKQEFDRLAIQFTGNSLSEIVSEAISDQDQVELEWWKDDVDFLWKTYEENFRRLKLIEQNQATIGAIGRRFARSTEALLESLLANAELFILSSGHNEQAFAHAVVRIAYRYALAAVRMHENLQAAFITWSETKRYRPIDFDVVWLPRHELYRAERPGIFNLRGYSLLRRGVLSTATGESPPEYSSSLPLIRFRTDVEAEHLYAQISIPTTTICDAFLDNNGVLSIATDLLLEYFARTKPEEYIEKINAKIDREKLYVGLRSANDDGLLWGKFFGDIPWSDDEALRFEDLLCPKQTCWMYTMRDLPFDERVAQKDFFQLLYQTIATRALSEPFACRTWSTQDVSECTTGSWQARRLCRLRSTKLPILFSTLKQCRDLYRPEWKPWAHGHIGGTAEVDLDYMTPSIYAAKQTSVKILIKVKQP